MDSALVCDRFHVLFEEAAAPNYTIPTSTLIRRTLFGQQFGFRCFGFLSGTRLRNCSLSKTWRSQHSGPLRHGRSGAVVDGGSSTAPGQSQRPGFPGISSLGVMIQACNLFKAMFEGEHWGSMYDLSKALGWIFPLILVLFVCLSCRYPRHDHRHHVNNPSRRS